MPSKEMPAAARSTVAVSVTKTMALAGTSVQFFKSEEYSMILFCDNVAFFKREAYCPL